MNLLVQIRMDGCMYGWIQLPGGGVYPTNGRKSVEKL